MTTAQPMNCLSLSTAAALTGRSTRTWQRRVEDGLVPRLSDANGRTLVPLETVRPALEGDWSEEDLQALLSADQGHASAQADIGAKFALAALRAPKISGGGGDSTDAVRIAHYFLLRAAEQGEADAMHWLGLLNAAGLSEARGHRDEDGSAQAQALKWIAKAAEHGHTIARQQLSALLASLTPGAQQPPEP